MIEVTLLVHCQNLAVSVWNFRAYEHAFLWRLVKWTGHVRELGNLFRSVQVIGVSDWKVLMEKYHHKSGLGQDLELV